jgi:hypothetical protein
VADFTLEQDETEILRHFPIWVDLCLVATILLAEFSVLAEASDRMSSRPMADEQVILILVIVSSLFLGSLLQFLILIMPPMVEITDKRILQRRRLGWDDPDALLLDAVVSVRQQGWRLIVSDGITSLNFFCPPIFSQRIQSAMGHPGRPERR